jgi:hypothetical protein
MNESGSRMMRPEDLEFRPTKRAKNKNKEKQIDASLTHICEMALFQQLNLNFKSVSYSK